MTDSTGYRTFNLSLKLITFLIVGLLLIFALFGRQNLELHRRNLEEMTFASAHVMSDLIKRSMRYSMLRNEREDIYQIIRTIGGEPGINRIRLFNKEGKISFSSADTEIDTLVDKNAESCYACHAEEQPLAALDRPDRVRIYRAPSGERILGLINPIENEESCHSAPCHAHPADQKVLGVLDVTMSLAGVDRSIRQGKREQVLMLTGAGLIICLVIAGLIWRMVHRPVRQLHVGTQRVAAGDLDYKIDVSSRDEMGQLAASFNRMTAEVKRANERLKESARTLETRVEDKTRELRRTHDRMIQVERMASMGKLAAIVAHEINNPLTGILTSARFLLKRLGRSSLGDGDREQALEHLDMIASESARCGEIVKGLLQFTRQSKGDYEPCDTRAILLDSLRLVQHKIDLMNLRVETDIASDLPPILCDAQEIKQALVAVLINACEAMTEGDGALQVGARCRAGQDHVEIWIRDSGSGMDEGTRRHVFEPFFTTKEQGKGVGLGLAVVTGIVSRHSGSIDLESAPGRGTTVRIQLPLATRSPARDRLEAMT